MDAAAAVVQELVDSYGAPTVYCTAGGIAVATLQHIVLPVIRAAGGRARAATAVKLVNDPSLNWTPKEVSDPANKGWGYAGVRFERCEDDDMVVMLVGDKHYPDISVRHDPQSSLPPSAPQQ